MTANRGGVEPSVGKSQPGTPPTGGSPLAAAAAISPDLERALADFERAITRRLVISPASYAELDDSNARYANARARLVELYAERVPLPEVDPAAVRPWWQEG